MPSLLVCGLVFLTTLSATSPQGASPEPAPPAINEAVDLDSNSPPPTAYDKAPPDSQPSFDSGREPFSLGQWARTIFALAIVLGLIYLSKFALIRLTGLRPGGSGNHLDVLERVQLDPKHALFIVDVKDKGKILLGGGNGDLRLLAQLESLSDAPADLSTFPPPSPPPIADSPSASEVNHL